jgi:hypothetical protein
MGNAELYSMIAKQRSNRKNRDARPFNSFIEKWRRYEQLLQAVEKSIKSKNCLNEAFEVYFNDISTVIFKLCKTERDLLNKFNKMSDYKKFDISDLVMIRYENYEIHEIVLEGQNFQNLDVINKVFSTILGKNFFNGFKNRKFKTQGPDKIPFEIPNDWYPTIKRYLDLRHTLVHDYDPKLFLNKQDVRALHLNIMIFIIATDVYLHDDYINPNLRDEFKL